MNWVFRFLRLPAGQKKRGQRKTSLPCRLVAHVGAQVAPQRCPILRMSIPILSSQSLGTFLKLKWDHF
jgi:hypothetical protein